MMMNGMGDMMAACMGGMGGMMAFMGAFWVAVVAAIVYVARRVWRGPQLAAPNGTPGDSALATLRDRFARGEIDRADYDERRRALAGDDARWP